MTDAHPMHLLWPSHDEPEWVLVFWFQRVSGMTELVGFEMKSIRTYYGEGQASANEREIFEEGAQHPDDYREVTPKALKASVLREPPIKELATKVLAGHRQVDQSLDTAVEAGLLSRNVLASMREQMGSADEDVRNYRRWSPRDFEVVAALYRDAVEEGADYTNVYVAERLTRIKGEKVTRKQAERLIHRARHEFRTLGKDE